MKTNLAYAVLTIAVSTLIASALDFEVRERREPGEGRRESRTRYSKVGEVGDESAEAQTKDEQYAEARTAPGVVLPGAYSAAFASLSGLPVAGSSWTEVTNRPYDADDARYRDPFASNSGGGAGLVSGRITGLAAGGGYLFIGGANGGVFRSGNNGQTWTPMTDRLPPSRPANRGWRPTARSGSRPARPTPVRRRYLGTGVYRLAIPPCGVVHGGDRVGGAELESTFVGKLRFDGIGSVYAATSRGLWKHSAVDEVRQRGSACSTRAGPRLDGVPRPDLQSPTTTSATTSQFSRKRRPAVLVNCAWRDGARVQRFLLFDHAGQTFALINPKGALNPQDVGRTSFAYASDGSRLYALVESMTKYTNSNQTALGGIYVSPSGNPTGPWNKIATSGKLGTSGSALKLTHVLRPGIQAWYNQFLDGRSRRSAITCSPASRRSTRGGRRRPLDDDRPVLEFRIPVLVDRSTQRQHVPADDARGSAFDRARRQQGVRRQRRRPLSPSAPRTRQREWQRNRLGRT